MQILLEMKKKTAHITSRIYYGILALQTNLLLPMVLTDRWHRRFSNGEVLHVGLSTIFAKNIGEKTRVIKRRKIPIESFVGNKS